jgi:hypothetical protein
MPEIICENCGSLFNKETKAIRRSKHHFCSHSCAAQHNNKTRIRKNSVNKSHVCEICGISVSSGRKRCDIHRHMGSGRKKIQELQHTKTCPKCRFPKPASEFYVKPKTCRLISYCRECIKADHTLVRRRIKSQCVAYKGGACELCGYDKCEAAMDFHHLDPNHKDFNVAKARSNKFESIKRELDKCILLCANCHREIHVGAANLPLI